MSWNFDVFPARMCYICWIMARGLLGRWRGAEGLTADPNTVGFLLTLYLSGLSGCKSQGWWRLSNGLNLFIRTTSVPEPIRGSHLPITPGGRSLRPSFPTTNSIILGKQEWGRRKNPQILLKKLRNVKIFSSGKCEHRCLLYWPTSHI